MDDIDKAFKKAIYWTIGDKLCPKCKVNRLREPEVFNTLSVFEGVGYICQACARKEDDNRFMLNKDYWNG